MSKKSLLTESEIARFKELAGIPLSKKDSKILSENKWGSVVEEKEEELDEAVEEEEEGEEEEMEDEGAEEGAEDEEVEVEMGDEEGGEEELDMDMGDEDLDMGAEGGDAEALVTDLLSKIGSLAKMVGVNLDIEGGEEHAEPDEDNMGGPSDMDADNMGDEELNEGVEGGITQDNVYNYVMSKIAKYRDMREAFEAFYDPSDYNGDNIITAYETLGRIDNHEYNLERNKNRRMLLRQLEDELLNYLPEEEPLEESSPVGFDPERRPNETPADRKYSRGSLSESALRQITQKVAARMNGISPTNKRRIVETVTNRVAARLIAEAKKAKGGIKEKMHAKKKLKEGSKGGVSKDAPKGSGPGNKAYGVKGKVANEYSLKSVKLPKNSGGQDTVVAKGGKAKTVPQGAGKKGGKGNTTN